jgi:hypothetical protein
MSEQAMIEAMGTYHVNMRAARALVAERTTALHTVRELTSRILVADAEFVFDDAAMTELSALVSALGANDFNLRQKLSIADGAAALASEQRPVILERKPLPKVADRVMVLDVPTTTHATDAARDVVGGN